MHICGFLCTFAARNDVFTMKWGPIYKEAERRLLEYQSLHHLRITPERLCILSKIVRHAGSFTPADVVEWVKKDFISQATVYNSLILFEKAQIVHCLRKQQGSRLMEYELLFGEQSTMQIVCSKCGRVSRVKVQMADTALRMKQYSNFIMRHYSIYMFGECKHCKKK